MPTAQLNVRVPAEHHDLMKGIAAKLRQDKGFAEALDAFVASVAPSLASVAGDSIASILIRLESIEARLADLDQKPIRTSLDAFMPVEGAEMATTTEALPKAANPPQRRRRWTDADDAVLRRIAAEGGTQADAAHELGRRSSVVNGKWKALRLPDIPRKGRTVTRRSVSAP
jgi:hypothetical protein